MQEKVSIIIDEMLLTVNGVMNIKSLFIQSITRNISDPLLRAVTAKMIERATKNLTRTFKTDDLIGTLRAEYPDEWLSGKKFITPSQVGCRFTRPTFDENWDYSANQDYVALQLLEAQKADELSSLRKRMRSMRDLMREDGTAREIIPFQDLPYTFAIDTFKGTFLNEG